MVSIYQNLQSDKQYKAACGLSLSEFESLFVIFDTLYFPKTANPYLTDKQPVLTDKREALFFVLHYFKSYPTLENMGLYFGFSVFSVSQYLEGLKPVLKTALSQKQDTKAVLFKDQSAFDKAFENVDEIYIDVTEIPVERPQDKQMQANKYSGKKNTYPQMAPDL